ncbi:hypothetical protein [Streptomyces sp. NPDC057740]|uniref:hypothetical protein n=1 Tax=Streptomyces sp. NPDC057740 TaxID=3346234 RepID=UPI0036BAAB92
MAFGAEELRVLRRALALALNPSPASPEELQACLRLAESLDEAMREGARLRAFLVADLARYRAALPGTAAGYLTLLEEALGAGYHPDPADLTALHALRGNPTAASLLQDVRARLAPVGTRPAIPASRAHLLALPGGLSEPTAAPHPPVDLPAQAAGSSQDPAKQPRKKPAERPAAPKPAPAPAPAPGRQPTPKPPRPIPTPGEVFPRRKPTPPSETPPQQLAAG